jgi:hypothetical protein
MSLDTTEAIINSCSFKWKQISIKCLDSEQQGKQKMITLKNFEESKNFSYFRKKCNPANIIAAYNKSLVKIKSSHDLMLEEFSRRTKSSFMNMSKEAILRLFNTVSF